MRHPSIIAHDRVRIRKTAFYYPSMVAWTFRNFIRKFTINDFDFFYEYFVYFATLILNTIIFICTFVFYL